MNYLIFKIRKSILNYKENLYTEHEFLDTVESINSMVTESEMYELKDFIKNFECELETIIFMANKESRRELFLVQIGRVEHCLNHFKYVA